jgi:hypothetical protein
MRPRPSIVLATLLGSAMLAPAGPAAASTTPAKTAPAKAAPAARPMVVPWIQDDYAKALQQARGWRKPIFIEAWAPW